MRWDISLKKKLLELAQSLKKNQYGQYLIKRANEGRGVR
jgi:glucose-1-phosphate thymidylyltransferase